MVKVVSWPQSLALTPFNVTILVRRPRQADLSKHISLEWKSLTDEEKAPYVRMSEEAKLVHARIYPGYKYQPRRKMEGTPGGKKSAPRPEASKKHGKSKKSGKESKATKRNEPQCETEVDDKPSEQSGDKSQAVNDVAIAQIQLPSVCIEIGVDGEEDSTSAGDPSKDWTWLPEQTLLPITWEHDQEFGTASDEVMHPLDANIDDGNEDEIEFGVFIVLFSLLGWIFTYSPPEPVLSLASAPGARIRGPIKGNAVLSLSCRVGVGCRLFRGPAFRLPGIHPRVAGQPSGYIS